MAPPAPKSSQSTSIDSDVSQILPHLYLSSLPTESDAARLKTVYGITHIINATAEYPPSPLLASNFTYLHIKAKDTRAERLAPYFGEVAQFIEAAQKEGGIVLIHCQQGISRSATLTIASLMVNGFADSVGEERKWDLASAVKRVRSRRRAIEPNSAFASELRNFERTLAKGKGRKVEEIEWTAITMGDDKTSACFIPLEEQSIRDQLGEAFIRLTSIAAIDHSPLPTPSPTPRQMTELLSSLLNSSKEHGSVERTLMRIVRLILTTTFDTYATKTNPRDQRARKAMRVALHDLLLSVGQTESQITGLLVQYVTEEEDDTVAEEDFELLWASGDRGRGEEKEIVTELGSEVFQAWDNSGKP